MSFFKNKYSGLLKRIKCLQFGLFYFRNNKFRILDSLKINGKYKEYKFIDRSNPLFIYEFTEICLNDCYRLKLLSQQLKSINCIVDVGANQGLFAILARQQFINSKIYCYEPNPDLKENLSHNATNISCTVYFEAVTKNNCKVELELGGTDLLTKTYYSDEGNITGTSLKKVIERSGGKIDILKLDCEGAEWDLFEDATQWEKIKALTMEYHLWAKKGSQFNDIAEILERLNFKILFHKQLSESFGLVTAIKKDITS